MSADADQRFPPLMAAKYLGLSEHTLAYWRVNKPDKLAFIKLGPAGKPGVRVQYLKRDLDAFLAKGGA